MSAVYPSYDMSDTPFTIIQSNQMEKLLEHLIHLYKHTPLFNSVFENFNVIVPSKVMGEWLKKQVAQACGISTLVTTEFWGRYYWTLMQRVLKTYAYAYENAQTKQILEVPEVAMLSKNVMQWRIFGFLSENYQQILANSQHALYPFVVGIIGENSKQNTIFETFLQQDIANQNADIHSLEQGFWQFSDEMANMLNRYISYREEWLLKWGENKAIDVKKMLSQKDKLQALTQHQSVEKLTSPDWLVEYYEQLEKAQRFLWINLFKDDFSYRKQLREQFWQAFYDNDPRIAKMCRAKLPKQIIIFTMQQLPPSEFEDLQRLSELVPITLLHFNPSEQFWADIVDKNWLIQQQMIDPSTVYLKEYGHTLLSRFGKQSREMFAMLANLSGNEYEKVEWFDDFYPNPQKTLLASLQNDILMLDEHKTKNKIQAMLKLNKAEQYQFVQQEQQKKKSGFLLNDLQFDTSLAVHICHSTVRQLEVLRGLLVGWLNYTDKPSDYQPVANERRLVSDILVLLPDIEAQRSVIEAIFPKGLGVDGFELPAKITGVVAKEVSQLWQAVTGYYTLLNQANARFNRVAVFDWLMLPKLYESFGLNFEQMRRACELLSEAGFVRGFDELHLKESLHAQDDDYRYTFAYALERLVAGLFMPNANAVHFGNFTNQYGDVEVIEPLKSVKMSDKSLILALCQIYETLHSKRNMAKKSQSVDDWLTEIESLMQLRFAVFNQSNAWLAIFSAQNDLKQYLTASQYIHTSFASQTQQLPLKLHFILQSIAQQIQKQQVSAEPTGMITFARIGAVRSLPYKLIVMLNLNLNDFPQRENKNRYNLMQAGMPKRGDRFREDDDLGAFLDAILCAKEACWLFYNGKSHTDTYEYLPANPVQELLDFLSHNANDNQLENAGEKLVKYLVTSHPALPFAKSYFEILPTSMDFSWQKSQIFPPAYQWFNLYDKLYNHQKSQATQTIKLWLKADLKQWITTWQHHQKQLNQTTKIEQMSLQKKYIHLTTILKSLQNPAKAFLTTQSLFVLKNDEELAEQETLQLNALGYYQLRNYLLKQALLGDKTQIFALNDVLPVGANRYHSFWQGVAKVEQDFVDFTTFLQTLNATELAKKSSLDFVNLLNFSNMFLENKLTIPQVLTQTQEQIVSVLAYVLDDTGKLSNPCDFVLTAKLPTSLTTSHWIDYHTTSGREKYQLQFWLSHLCWQVARQTTAEQAQVQDGFSLWHYQTKTIYFPAIDWQKAYTYLQDWLMLFNLMQTVLLVLPPATTLQYLFKRQENTETKPIQLIADWIKSDYTHKESVEKFEYVDWQVLIGDQKPSVIIRFIQTLGEWVYTSLKQNMIILQDKQNAK